MNRIYKVVWNSACGCYTAVSEIAKTHKNAASKTVGAVLATALLGMSSADAQITDNVVYGDTVVDGDYTVTPESKWIMLSEDSKLTLTGSLSATNGNVIDNDRSILNVGKNVDLKDSTIYLINGAKAVVNGDMTVSGHQIPGSIDWNNVNIIFNASELSVINNFTLSHQVVKADLNSSLTVGGNLTNDNGYIYMSDGSVNVKRDFIAKGKYIPGSYDSQLDAEGKYFTSQLFAKNITISGNLKISDNAQIGAEAYSRSPVPTPEEALNRPVLTPDQRGKIKVSGNANLSRNSALGAYNGADIVVEKDLVVTEGAKLSIWGDANAEILGNMSITGQYSSLEAGDNSHLTVRGNISVSDGAAVNLFNMQSTTAGQIAVGSGYITNYGNITIGKDAVLHLEGDSKLVSKGKNAKITIEKGSRLETAKAGSISIVDGSVLEVDRDVVLSKDLMNTKDGVAKQTFSLDGLSRMKITSLDEVNMDEAKAIRKNLLTDDGGMLDINIKVDAPQGADTTVSLNDALDYAGTTAYQEITVGGIDTGSKSLSELAGNTVPLSWGSAGLASGQESLNLGAAKLELNNPGESGLFVKTSDGKPGNVLLGAGSKLNLNNSGTIGDISGAGALTLGSDTKSSDSLISAGNLGTSDSALLSVSVGSVNDGVKVSVNAKNINAVSVNAKGAEVSAQNLNTVSLAAENSSIKANNVTAQILGAVNSKIEANNVSSLTVTLSDGALKANSVKTSMVIVGSDKSNGSASTSGVFDAGSLELTAGGMLFGDPEIGMKSSVESITNLSALSVDKKYDGADHAVLNANLISGLNNILALGTSSEAQARSIVASMGLTDANGSLSDTYVSNVLLLNKRLEVLDGTARAENPSINRVAVTRNLTDLTAAGAADADVILGANSGVVITSDLAKNLVLTGNAAVTLDKKDAKVLVTADAAHKAKVIVGGAHTASKKDVEGLKVFANDNRTTDKALVDGAENVEVVMNSSLYTGGRLSSDGRITGVGVNASVIYGLTGASAPVKELVYNVLDSGSYQDGSGVSFIFDKASSSDGSEIEDAARLGVLGGSYQASKAAHDASVSAVAGRFGIGNSGTMVVQNDNTAMWANVTYRRNKSDNFNADGIKYGARVKSFGGVIGLDYTLMDTVTFGGFVSVGSGKAKGDTSGATSDFDYHGLGLYADVKALDCLNVLADVSFNKVKNDVSDNFGLKTKADTKVWSAGVTAKLDLSFGSVNAAPYTCVRFARYDMDDGSVTSPVYGFVSKYKADRFNVVSVPLGVDLSMDIKCGEWNMTPGASFNVTYNSKTKAKGSSTFTGSAVNALLESEIMDRFTYGAGLKLNANKGNAVFGLGVNYTGSKNTREVGAQMNFSYKF